MTQGMTSLSAGQHCHLHREWDDTAGNRRPTAEFEIEHDSVGPCVISYQMFVKSEFPLDSALVCDSDLKKMWVAFFSQLLK